MRYGGRLIDERELPRDQPCRMDASAYTSAGPLSRQLPRRAGAVGTSSRVVSPTGSTGVDDSFAGSAASPDASDGVWTRVRCLGHQRNRRHPLVSPTTCWCTSSGCASRRQNSKERSTKSSGKPARSSKICSSVGAKGGVIKAERTKVGYARSGTDAAAESRRARQSSRPHRGDDGPAGVRASPTVSVPHR
jgi:hypothetical protein